MFCVTRARTKSGDQKKASEQNIIEFIHEKLSASENQKVRLMSWKKCSNYAIWHDMVRWTNTNTICKSCDYECDKAPTLFRLEYFVYAFFMEWKVGKLHSQPFCISTCRTHTHSKILMNNNCLTWFELCIFDDRINNFMVLAAMPVMIWQMKNSIRTSNHLDVNNLQLEFFNA